MAIELRRSREGPISFLSGGEGEPFLLLHGIPGSSESWRRVGTILGRRHRVVIPDMLGFGESEDPSADFFLEAQADALAVFLSALKIDSLYIGGHDIGGPLAVTLLRRYPELKVRGLVIAAANLLCQVRIPWIFRLARAGIFATPVNWALIGNGLAQRWIYRAAVRRKSTYSWHDHHKHFEPRGLRLTRLLFQRTMVRFEETFDPIERYLQTLSLPTLVLWGGEDPILQRSLARRLQQTVRDSALEVYEDTGHFVPEERPQQVAEDIMNFFAADAAPKK